MKRLFSIVLCVSIMLGLGSAIASASPLELTMYFPVNVGGTAAATIERFTGDFNAQNTDVRVTPVYTGN